MKDIPPGMAYYPLLGTIGPIRGDHMAFQVPSAALAGDDPYVEDGRWKSDEGPSVIDKDGVQYDPAVHWRTRDGELVLIVTLSDRHLRNTLRMLWRTANRWSFEVVKNEPNGEQAAEDFAEWAGELGGAKPSKLILMSPIGKRGAVLLDEWARRGYARDTWWAAY